MIKFLASAAILAVAAAAPASAVIVYNTAPGLVGNQSYNETTGLDFAVNTTVTITALGAFDSGSDGISTDIFIALFDSAGTIVSPIINFNGATNDGSSAYVFASIAPLVLTPGAYQIGGWGFNSTDRNYNTFGDNPGPITFNSDLGKLSLIGTRYSLTAGTLATIPDVGLTRYGSGTLVTAVPEPASWALLVGGFGMVGFAMRRRATASVAA